MHSVDAESGWAKAGARLDGARTRLRFFVTRHPLGAVGAVIMAVFVLAAIFADGIAASDPLTTNASVSLAPPSAQHLLGADFMGRDIFSRIVHGARISLAVGIGSTTLGCVLGVMLGLASGYIGGWVDLLSQRLVDILLALREQPFVEAAKAVGMSEMRIALRHVLPNTLAPLIVLATAQLGSAILTEASLSFLGLGIPEPYPS